MRGSRLACPLNPLSCFTTCGLQQSFGSAPRILSSIRNESIASKGDIRSMGIIPRQISTSCREFLKTLEGCARDPNEARSALDHVRVDQSGRVGLTRRVTASRNGGSTDPSMRFADDVRICRAWMRERLLSPPSAPSRSSCRWKAEPRCT